MSNAQQNESRQRSGAAAERPEAGQMAELSFKVPDMTDGHAATAITRAVRKLRGIAQVQLDPHTGWVLITAQNIDSDAIRHAITAAGYRPQL